MGDWTNERIPITVDGGGAVMDIRVDYGAVDFSINSVNEFTMDIVDALQLIKTLSGEIAEYMMGKKVVQE